MKTVHYEIWQDFNGLEKADSTRNYICFYGTSKVNGKKIIIAIDYNQMRKISLEQYLGILMKIRDNQERGIMSGDIEVDKEPEKTNDWIDEFYKKIYAEQE